MDIEDDVSFSPKIIYLHDIFLEKQFSGWNSMTGINNCLTVQGFLGVGFWSRYPSAMLEWMNWWVLANIIG